MLLRRTSYRFALCVQRGAIPGAPNAFGESSIVANFSFLSPSHAGRRANTAAASYNVN